MAHKIWHNGRLIPFEDATIHVLSHVVHYGSSVFEGIRCYNTAKGSAIFRLQDHMRRLVDSATIHRMELPYDQQAMEEAVIETIQSSGLQSCYIRPVILRGTGSLNVNPMGNSVETYIAVFEWGAYLGEDSLENGIDVEVASWNRMAPNTHPAMAKSGGNYLNASLVKMNAILNGFAEGIMLSVDGYLAEGSGENLFIVRDGALYTAPRSLSILPGITRASVMVIAEELGLEIIEERLPREALYLADELFFTGTAAEVTPIRSVDHYTIGSGTRGPITAKIQRAFFDIVHEGNDSHSWLTPVPAAHGS